MPLSVSLFLAIGEGWERVMHHFFGINISFKRGDLDRVYSSTYTDRTPDVMAQGLEGNFGFFVAFTLLGKTHFSLAQPRKSM